MDITRIRDIVCHDSVIKAKERCEQWGVDIESRIRRRRRMPGELARDAGLSAGEEIVRILKSILDRLHQEMTTRFTRLKDLILKFGFLLDVDKLLKSDDLDSLRQNCIEFGNVYDIEGIELFNEIRDCRMLLETRQNAAPDSPTELLSFIVVMAKMFSQIYELLCKFFLLLRFQLQAVSDPSAN